MEEGQTEANRQTDQTTPARLTLSDKGAPTQGRGRLENPPGADEELTEWCELVGYRRSVWTGTEADLCARRQVKRVRTRTHHSPWLWLLRSQEGGAICLFCRHWGTEREVCHVNEVRVWAQAGRLPTSV